MKYLITILYMCTSIALFAQDSFDKRTKSSAKDAVMSLSKSLEEDEPDENIALNYENVAKELATKGEFARAETYLTNALNLYTRLRKTEKIAVVSREIAKVQEAQSKLSDAISNYDNASRLTQNASFKELNTNDANRLRNRSNPKQQSPLIQRNIEILQESDESSMERSMAFQQMAEVSMQLKEPALALSNLQSALEEVKDQPLAANKVQREIANVYAADNQPEMAEASLKEAYETAIHEGNTLDAKKSLEQLVDQYRNEKKNRLALEAYADFMAKLEPLIKADSTLIDDRFFQVHEQKIAQLEKERALKDELISRQNIFNNVLQAFIIIVLIFLLLIIRSLQSIKKKNKRIALQSLRREMNPHFIFNSLNSVNQYIAQNNELEANKYLSSYSKLMRNMMENSNKDFTSLSTELEQLKEYLDLESLRFRDKFDYRIDIDDLLDTDSIYVPNMLIQPQLENAIWHGLRYKEEKGLLTLSIHTAENELLVTIDDNGIGRKRSQELKTKNQKEHKSRGLTNTNERISLLNSLYHTHISMEIRDKEGENGVTVVFRFPLKHKE